MIRAPQFRYYAAKSIEDACVALADCPDAMLLAGGTDVVPKLKRRQVTPSLLISLRHAECGGHAAALSATMTIADLIRRTPPGNALAQAAAQIATPLIRNRATIGGNLAVDTRCNYYDQSAEWRRAIDFCKKTNRDAICWVAPSSPRCWAVSSSDLAPALIALGARVTLQSVDGERELPLEDLYRDDGITYLAKKPHEIVTAIHVQPKHSIYLKLRRRGSFDFPVLGVAAAIELDRGVVTHARVALGAVASRPIVVPEAELLIGTTLSDEIIDDFAERAARHAKPLDNTDFHMTWRKRAAKAFLARAVRELRNGGKR